MQVLYFVVSSCDCSSNSSEMSGNSPDSGEQNPPMEQEKRIRREIANSNERRRMQSINAGFQSLRTLLPHHEGEKLSKVSNALLSLRLLLLSACVIYT
jgi:Helix-loop-helix DNA-binding domain